MERTALCYGRRRFLHGGLAVAGPVMASYALIIALATLAIPGSANFAGEFFILLGAFNSKLALACIAFTGVALASVYMLRAYIRTFHNRRGPAGARTWRRWAGWRSAGRCSRPWR